MRWRRLAGCVMLAALALGAASGCNIIKAFAFFFGPERVQKAEFHLAPGRMALLVDTTRGEEYNPIFVDALQTRLAELFDEHKVKVELVPQEEVLRLRQQHPDFGKWSVAKIGRELKANQVLALSVEKLQLRATPEMPVLEPEVQLRMRLVATDRPNADASRLWPSPTSEREGRPVKITRPPVEATSALIFDQQAMKLGRDTAWEVGAPFYDVNLEKIHLREP